MKALQYQGKMHFQRKQCNFKVKYCNFKENITTSKWYIALSEKTGNFKVKFKKTFQSQEQKLKLKRKPFKFQS